MIPQLAKPTSTPPTQAGSFHWAEAHPGTLYARVCRQWEGGAVTTEYDFVDPRLATDLAFAANVRMHRSLIVLPGAPPPDQPTGRLVVTGNSAVDMARRLIMTGRG